MHLPSSSSRAGGGLVGSCWVSVVTVGCGGGCGGGGGGGCLTGGCLNALHRQKGGQWVVSPVHHHPGLHALQLLLHLRACASPMSCSDNQFFPPHARKSRSIRGGTSIGGTCIGVALDLNDGAVEKYLHCPWKGVAHQGKQLCRMQALHLHTPTPHKQKQSLTSTEPVLVGTSHHISPPQNARPHPQPTPLPSAHWSYRSTAPHLGKHARFSELNSLLPHCKHLHLRADAHGRAWTHGACVGGLRLRICSRRHHRTWTGSAPCGVM